MNDRALSKVRHNEFKLRLVHQAGGLERLPGPLLRHPLSS